MSQGTFKRHLISHLLAATALGLTACGGGDSAPSTSTPTTIAPTNTAPEISGTPTPTLPANDPFEFIPAVSDLEGDTLVFSINNMPEWASFDTTTGRLSGTPSGVDVGNHDNIQISVTDGIVTVSLPPFSLTVEAAVLPLSLPSELDGLNMTLVLEENFDDQLDFATQATRSFCQDSGARGSCENLPDGWTDFVDNGRWHPSEIEGSEAGLQINATAGRGGAGKSLVIWDESYGAPSQWGSDAMLATRLEAPAKDIYTEMWLKYQPGYRWHHLEPFSSRGLNYSKVMRITSVVPDAYAFSYFSGGTNEVIALADTVLWAFDSNGERIDRGRMDVAARCAPRGTNYRCGDDVGGIRGDLQDTTRFEERFGGGATSDWHKIGLRAKLNSAPGVADGILQVWVDDVLQAEALNMTFLGDAADPELLLNMVSFGGNLHNYPEPEAERFEQWHAIDDIRVFAIGE